MECPEALIVRDLCDYAKHGPKLKRTSVRVDQTGVKQNLELDFTAFAAGVPNNHTVPRFVVTLKGGTDHLVALDVLHKVIEYWRGEFSARSL